MWTIARSAFMLGLILVLAGCQTVGPLPAADLSQPGWSVRQGQAVWKPGRDRPDIAGEIVIATHPSGRSVVQFIKTPFPIVLAQRDNGRWQVQFGPEGRRFSGRGNPPRRLIWLRVPEILQSQTAPRQWELKPLGSASWSLENRSTGESLEIHLWP